jgi:dinuclear metal center YbgI/SA1388 family protein
MRLHKLLQTLDEISPFELQEAWDNSGLIVGDRGAEVGHIYLSLDIEETMFDSLEEGSVLLVHHPLIFKGIRQIDFARFPGNIIKRAIEKGIAIVAMHTNFDQTHLNRYVLEEVLGYRSIRAEGYLAYFEVEKPFDTFAKEIALKLGIADMRVVKGCDVVKTAALCTGAGASLIDELEVDCLLTGDIKYHEALAAKESGISLIDIGHYESERYFASCMQKALQNKGLNGIIANSKNPFSHIKG